MKKKKEKKVPKQWSVRGARGDKESHVLRRRGARNTHGPLVCAPRVFSLIHTHTRRATHSLTRRRRGASRVKVIHARNVGRRVTTHIASALALAVPLGTPPLPLYSAPAAHLAHLPPPSTRLPPPGRLATDGPRRSFSRYEGAKGKSPRRRRRKKCSVERTPPLPPLFRSAPKHPHPQRARETERERERERERASRRGDGKLAIVGGEAISLAKNDRVLCALVERGPGAGAGGREGQREEEEEIGAKSLMLSGKTAEERFLGRLLRRPKPRGQSVCCACRAFHGHCGMDPLPPPPPFLSLPPPPCPAPPRVLGKGIECSARRVRPRTGRT
jgi:hypothetical protein